MSVHDELFQSNFFSRLKNLQLLCSESDPELPSALLFVTGQDGRNNKGSSMILKYLLLGAGKFLFDGSLDLKFDPLDDIVILIKESSVSILWSHTAKAIVGPLFETIPFLIEYLPSVSDESDSDLFQSWKCVDFKRMLLDSVSVGSIIGIPVPLGYDDIQDIENWPLFQSFAIEEVFSPTGFFSTRYIVADISEHIDILFRSVDGCVVNQGQRSFAQSILPHALQSIDILDTSSSAQRTRLTAEDVAGPLEMLFEFGELDATFPPDPRFRPRVLIGSDTKYISEDSSDMEWRDRTVGENLHLIVEGSDPSTGIRWNRTYFLRRGRGPAVDPVDLRLSEEDLDSEYRDHQTTTDHDQWESDIQNLRLLESRYLSLSIALRLTVRFALASSSDISEVGQKIQALLNSLLTGSPPRVGECGDWVWTLWEEYRTQYRQSSHPHPDLIDASSPIFLDLPELKNSFSSETLRIHMDCMDGLGRVVSSEDVRDIGGSCWLYVRASIQGPYLPNGELCAVSIGDTFLFSSSRTITDCLFQLPQLSTRYLPTHVNSTDGRAVSLLLSPGLGDCFCLTQPVPLWVSMTGPGFEEAVSMQLSLSTRTPHRLGTLGLGKELFQTSGLGVYSLPILTDHPLFPSVRGDIRLFSEGLVIERLDNRCPPIIVSLGEHVDCFWTLSLSQALDQFSDQIHSMNLHSPLEEKSSVRSGLSLLSFDSDPLLREMIGEENGKKTLDSSLFGSSSQAGLGSESETILIVFRLKTSSNLKSQTSIATEDTSPSKEDDDDDSYFRELRQMKRNQMTFENDEPTQSHHPVSNPLEVILPIHCSEQPTHFALILKPQARSTPSVSTASHRWRDVLTSLRIPTHRGKPQSSFPSSQHLPFRILNSLVSYLDSSLRSIAPSSDPFSFQAPSNSPEGFTGYSSCPEKCLEISLRSSALPTSLSTLHSAFFLPALGLVPMRCVESLSSQCKSLSNTKTSIEELDKKRNLVLVAGAAGSGCVSFGLQISERLNKRLAQLGKKTRFLTVDLSVLGSLCYSIEPLDTAPLSKQPEWTSESSASREPSTLLRQAEQIIHSCILEQLPSQVSTLDDVLCLSLILPPSNLFLSYSNLLSFLASILNAQISFCISVLTPQSPPPLPSSRMVDGSSGEVSGWGLGRELEASVRSGIISEGFCDLAVLIDPCSHVQGKESSSFGDLSRSLSTFNPRCLCTRISPSSLWLADDLFDRISSSISKKTKHISRIELNLLSQFSRGSLTSLLQPSSLSFSQFSDTALPSPVECLTTLSLSPLVSCDRPHSPVWALPQLLRILKFLFPSASLQTGSVSTDTWQAPPPSPSVIGLARALQLAQVKVLTQLQQREGLKVCEEGLEKASSEYSSTLKALRTGSLSLHCHLKLKGGLLSSSSISTQSLIEDRWVVIEASPSSVILRPCPPHHSQQLHFRALLNPDTISLALRIFQLCQHRPLPFRAPPLPSEIPSSKLGSIQARFENDIPLPSGWWFDGRGFVDILGNRKEFRPDIHDLVDLHLQDLSNEAENFNSLLSQNMEYL